MSRRLRESERVTRTRSSRGDEMFEEQLDEEAADHNEQQQDPAATDHIDEDAGKPVVKGRRSSRIDPVMREAGKRGLDVDKLHASRTPAWRNLRTRPAQADGPSYFDGLEEDQDQDHNPTNKRPSDTTNTTKRGSTRRSRQEEKDGDDEALEYQPSHSEEEPEDDELPSEEDDDEDLEDEEEEGHRYSRRDRQVVQRYTPGRPKNRRTRRRQQVSDDDESDSEDDRRHDAFSQRYSVRDRKTIDRYNPTAAHKPGGSGDKAGDKHGFDDGEDTDGNERKQYSFRDRSLVTIKPSSSQPPSGQQQHHGSGDRYGDRKRPRMERLSSRLRRAGRADGDLLDMPAAGGHMMPFTSPGRALIAPPKPWELALTAAGLAPGTNVGDGQGGGAIPAAAAHHNHPGAATANGSNSLEITPVEVDPTVTFESVGGLAPYIRALKEMVFLPLVYPELFDRFGISPPRGVLFYGPPGTGKTLVARALAAHAARAAPGKKVSFFMRKGADVLSKWVGEAERHLRLLFEEARKHQPSIIFFDEIDGLAPVRSSKADQIHNSIVSTLLALMDGLDSRGQVVVIGATNRVDALDGALRRPGRFDRELPFPLPSQQARREILTIHTRKWSERPGEDLVEELAAETVGYCGADLRALCTEASLAALRRRYPQIYEAESKLLIDPGEVKVDRRDFISALGAITPASHRAAAAHARPVPPSIMPLLQESVDTALNTLRRVFPPAAACLDGEIGPGSNLLKSSSGGGAMRPRLLICGGDGCGQNHLGPAVLHALEGLQAHAVGLPSLLSDASARSPEEALVHAVAEARRAAPAVLYLPHLQLWWDTAPSSLRATLWALLADLPGDLPLLLLATADVPATELDPGALALFGGNIKSEAILQLPVVPSENQRSLFFAEPARAIAFVPDEDEGTAAATATANAHQPLPLAPDAVAAEEEARKAQELAIARKKFEEDQAVLRAFRMLLRDVVTRMLTNRRWEAFWQPVDPEEDAVFYERVAQPMDLCTLLWRVDARMYTTPEQFLADLALIPEGERQYWGDHPTGPRHISRACAVEDAARAALEATLPSDLRDRLERMAARGGPAPPPPGMEHLVMAPPQPPPASKPRKPSNAADGGDEDEGDDDDGSNAARRASRHMKGATEVDDRVIHEDPEAWARRIRLAKKAKQQSQSAVVQEEATEQQQQEDGGDKDVVMTDAAPVVAHDAATIVVEPESNVLGASTKNNLPETSQRPVVQGAKEAMDTTATATKEVAQVQPQETVVGGGNVLLAKTTSSAPKPPSEEELARAAGLQRVLVDVSKQLNVEKLEGLLCVLKGVADKYKRETERDGVVQVAGEAARQFVLACQ